MDDELLSAASMLLLMKTAVPDVVMCCGRLIARCNISRHRLTDAHIAATSVESVEERRARQAARFVACEVCGTFISRTNLTKHRAHHRAFVEESEGGVMCCE